MTTGLRLPGDVVEAMRADLPETAEQVVVAVISEVPSYSEPFRGRMGRTIETAVGIALGGFLDLAATGIDKLDGTDGALGERVQTVLEAAYALGRGEARSGRSMDALNNAYRVGARTAWRRMSAVAVGQGLPAAETARFAELVFDYIDQISTVSMSGHADELSTAGRVRERRLERLAEELLAGADDVDGYAERAEWAPPRSLTTVLLNRSAVSSLLSQLDERTLSVTDSLPEADDDDLAALLVPDVRSRSALLRTLGDRAAVIGPARGWQQVRSSYLRALRVHQLTPDRSGPVDSDDHLVGLVIQADPEAIADLRTRVLAPLAELRPATAEKLVETLRSWLLNRGRREAVAGELFVHPQTVRYRMGQLREVFGDALDDPQTILELTVALAVPPIGDNA
ncbi:PucR family transcriptional regulator [Nocardioides limicola]|uniref:PucR family transcriptional regulator n=1 Tax=Nocardioides limicola TaxID=2803368 RepID=UPI0027DD3241|nr:helix-turn-helix domain-containing protein [Nocardioides sp. DJM-14]